MNCVHVEMGAQESSRRVTIDNSSDDTIGVVKVLYKKIKTMDLGPGNLVSDSVWVADNKQQVYQSTHSLFHQERPFLEIYLSPGL